MHLLIWTLPDTAWACISQITWSWIKENKVSNEYDTSYEWVLFRGGGGGTLEEERPSRNLGRSGASRGCMSPSISVSTTSFRSAMRLTSITSRVQHSTSFITCETWLLQTFGPTVILQSMS